MMMRMMLMLLLKMIMTQGFVLPPRSMNARARGCSRDRALVKRASDLFFNFEGLKKKLNLTHFDNPLLEANAPHIEEEDYATRPDLVKARELGTLMAPEFLPDHYPSVSLYFHVAPYHLQSYREAVQDFIVEQRKKYHGGTEVEDDAYWEAFQFIGLPAELEGTGYPGSQAGRVPSRCRVLLCGTFRNKAVEERAKADVAAWRKELKARLKTYDLMPEDPIETMPLSQAVYRRILPHGGSVSPTFRETEERDDDESMFVLSFLQASWSSERKIRSHIQRLRQYIDDVLTTGGSGGSLAKASRADLLQNPDYPSAQKVWHKFPTKEALVLCLSTTYTHFLSEGAKFRARVNHVEQAFAPLAPSTMPVLSQRLASTGRRMPLVGYGTACYRGREREGDMTIADAVRTAVRAGCRLLDCSPDYGNQLHVGKSLQDIFKARELRREHLFITTSLGQARLRLINGVRPDVQQSLNELGVKYLDAVLLPYPEGAAADGLLSGEDIDLITRAWSELKSLVKEGLVRHLGVSDFPLAALRFLDEWESRDDQQGLRPDICQVEHHPYYRDEELMEYCQSRSGATGPIQVVAHTPLGRPALSRPPGTNILKEPLIVMSAEALEQTPAQVTLRWNVQQGIAVIPNSLCRYHILQNAVLNTFNMAPFRMAVFNEMTAVRSLRFCNNRFSSRGGGDDAKPAAYSYADIKEKGLVYLDDGTVIEPGSEYEYMELSVEVFERLELGDLAELFVEPKQIDGEFPGVDVEQVE